MCQVGDPLFRLLGASGRMEGKPQHDQTLYGGIIGDQAGHPSAHGFAADQQGLGRLWVIVPKIVNCIGKIGRQFRLREVTLCPRRGSSGAR